MSAHLETEIVSLLRNELAPGERARVRAHLDACAECRRAVEDVKELLARLGASLPAPPEIHWGRYRAELRERLEGRPARRWWAQPLPLAASAALIAVLVVLGIQGLTQRGVGSDLVALEETVIGSRLGLIEQYRIVERLDLLEDLDVIRDLHRLPAREG